MNSDPNEDIQRRLQQLEEEIKSPEIDYSKVKQSKVIPGLSKWKSYIEDYRRWFNGLSSIKKIAATGVLLLLTIWVLQAVFKLVASTVTLLVLGGLIYLGYKFFIASNSPNRH
ncbi:hypothetical protein H6F32_15850 [Anabaena sp. FACHB-1237]|uniref:hypothetical protein n=1 Tax=Anabaena sp. FACHB-1237 TaxID=2692769 RepID=UPI00168141CC|nr:hypothetical protein [Anabaena sp. FACHB-1237]MBD2139011.1 hypothetical protein [Anabaena sp. FACHB-1237]